MQNKFDRREGKGHDTHFDHWNFISSPLLWSQINPLFKLYFLGVGWGAGYIIQIIIYTTSFCWCATWLQKVQQFRNRTGFDTLTITLTLTTAIQLCTLLSFREQSKLFAHYSVSDSKLWHVTLFHGKAKKKNKKKIKGVLVTGQK